MNRECVGAFFSTDTRDWYRCLGTGRIIRVEHEYLHPGDVCPQCKRTIAEDSHRFGNLPTTVHTQESVTLPVFGTVLLPSTAGLNTRTAQSGKTYCGQITGTALASSANTLVRTYCDQHGLDLVSFDVSPDGTAIDFRYTLPDWSVLDQIKRAIAFLERSHELLEEQQQARKEEMTWQPIATAPRDGTWILGLNNRFNCAVIIWDDKNSERPEWIHPYSDMRLSPFWNGACGSEAIYWMPLPDYRHLPEYKLRQKQAAVATAISQDGDGTDDDA